MTYDTKFLRFMADQVASDLLETYSHLFWQEHDRPAPSPAELRHWEDRRRALLHVREALLATAGSLERVNAMDAPADNLTLLGEIVGKAAA